MYTPSPKIYTVNELNNYTKTLLESDDNLKHLFVTGEISNYKAHYSGHLYMTIKDETAAIKAVMFAGNAAKLRFSPENGMKVLIFGTVSLFPRDGSYQLYINDMQPDGIGALSIAFEQLKKKLSSEGLFDPSHKKPIPAFPQRVGVITSSTGAAIRDIFNVLGRRYPAAEIVVRPAQVQGDGAAEDIAKAIEEFNIYKGADVLIVGRGGGSVEDLWAFNEEVVARAVFESEIPVISAVGHETDYTICDFVADLRAPTPSAAAELAVPDCAELKSQLAGYSQQLISSVKNIISNERSRLVSIGKSGALKDPVTKLNENRRELMYLGERLCDLTQNRIEADKMHFSALVGKLEVLSPLSVIARGYAIVHKGESLLTEARDLNKGDEISIRLNGGKVTANVTEVCEE
ncbi:MAG: exodeoxyribonuclease VII large subunit [Clostridia bacterium]|nr:exodeoxyribonuclease VII large subunit [Clostridia bacterium]